MYLMYPALAFLLPGLVGRRSVPLETPRLATLASVILRHARWITAGAVVAGALLAVAATRVELDAGLTHLRPRASTARAVEEDIEQRFGSYNQRAAVLVRRDDLETALRDSEAVAAILGKYRDEGLLRSFETVTFLVPSERTQRERLDRFNRLPRAAAVRELDAALPRHGFATAPFAAFLRGFEQERNEIVRLGDEELEPMSFLIERYIRGHSGAPTVATYFEPSSSESLQIVADRLRRDLAGAPVAIASRVLLENELHRTLRRELIAFSVLSLVGNFVLLVATLGRFSDAVVVLAPVVWAVVALLAGMGWTGIPLDPVNLIVPTLVLGLGVDFGAFLVTSARERGGMPAAIRSTGRALLVTAFTTIAGFGFLGLSRYPALSGMGILAAAGLLLALVASILLVPALWGTARND
jgi:predicted RND superfamily exporter protein